MQNVILLMVLAVSVFLPHQLCKAQQPQLGQPYDQNQPLSQLSKEIERLDERRSASNQLQQEQTQQETSDAERLDERRSVSPQQLEPQTPEPAQLDAGRAVPSQQKQNSLQEAQVRDEKPAAVLLQEQNMSQEPQLRDEKRSVLLRDRENSQHREKGDERQSFLLEQQENLHRRERPDERRSIPIQQQSRNLATDRFNERRSIGPQQQEQILQQLQQQRDRVTEERRSLLAQQPPQSVAGVQQLASSTLSSLLKSKGLQDEFRAEAKLRNSRNHAREVTADLSTVLPNLPTSVSLPNLLDDSRWQHKLSDVQPYQQPPNDEELPLWHDIYDTLYRPVNRVQPAPRSPLAELQERGAGEVAPSSTNTPPVSSPGPTDSQHTLATCADGSIAVVVTPAPAHSGATTHQPPAAAASSAAAPDISMSAKAQQESGGMRTYELPQVKEVVSPKQSQLQKLVQQLYQAEAQVQLEAQQIQQAQAVASAAQQTLEEAANNVKVISAALQSAQEAVASAAIRAHIAQLQLAAHDQMLFTARQNVDSLSAQMVGLQAEVGIQYDVHHLNVPELLGRLQQPLSSDQTPTPIPTLIPLGVGATGAAANSLQQLLDEANAGAAMSAHIADEDAGPIRRGVTLGLEGVIPNEQLLLDPAAVLSDLREKYRSRRDLKMLIDELRKPLVQYYKRGRK